MRPGKTLLDSCLKIPTEELKLDFGLVSSNRMQLFEAVLKVVPSKEEEQEKTIEEVYEKLEALEKGMREFFPVGSPRIDGQNLEVSFVL
ncbi:hypothetical protein QYF36_022551 [Acer negundo]|nr:hypothetical protein QYF36_022551 [Acer negundo]